MPQEGDMRASACLLSAVFLGFFFFLPAPAPADTGNAGNVIAARRDAWAERGREKPQLFSKSPVFTGDRLTTNPVGRLQVLFNDDSVLMLAPDSKATISEYVYSEGAGESGNAFNINLARGVTKLISGRMVENEPGSMRVETPEISVGIQGTSVAVESAGGISKVTVLHATPGKPTIVYCGEDRRQTRLETSGTVLIMNAEERCVPQIRRITPDEQMFLRSLSLPLSGPELGVGDVAQGGGATLPVADFSLPVDADAPLVLADNSGSGLLNPNLPQFFTDFSGTYAGTLSGMTGPYNAVTQPGSPLAGDPWSGDFSLSISNLNSAPQITGFDMKAVNDNSSLQYGFQISGSGNIGGVDSNGNFSFNTSGHPDVTFTGNYPGGGSYLGGSY